MEVIHLYGPRKIGPKGDVVIPKELRDRFGITPGTVVRIEPTADAIIISRQKSPKASGNQTQ